MEGIQGSRIQMPNKFLDLLAKTGGQTVATQQILSPI